MGEDDDEEETKEREEGEGEEGETPGGRMMLYNPTIVFSKVYGSKRLYEKPGAKKKRAITKDGANGLIRNLESLFINATVKEGGEESSTEEEEKENETEKKKNKVLGSFEIQESSFSASVVPDQIKSSTKMTTKVRRSRRLAK